MALNNNLLYNAALSGFVSGAVAGANQTDPTVVTPAAADYAALVGMGVLFATAMDAAIAPDVVATPQPAGSGPISVGTPGVAIAPTTGAIQEAETGKIQLLQALCFGISFQRYPYQPQGMTNAQFTSTHETFRA